MDSTSVDASVLAGAGPDGNFGTVDDIDVQFVIDTYDNLTGEGFGIHDTLNTIAFGLSTGTGAGLFLDVETMMLTYTGDSSSDNVTVKNTANAGELKVLFGSTTKVYTGVTEFKFIGQRGDDTLTIDFSKGDPTPSGGITVDGGTGTDKIKLENGTGISKIEHTFDSAKPVNIDIDNSTIKYDGVEQIVDLLTATDREIHLTPGDDVVTLQDDGTAGNNISRFSSQGAVTQMDFVSPLGKLMLEAKAGDDSVTLEDLDNSFAAAVVIKGQSNNDIINASSYDGAVTLQGLSGNDILTGGSGNDSIDGGSGTDTVNRSGDVDFTISSGTMSGLGTDQLSSIEKIDLTGGASANNLTIDFASGNPILTTEVVFHGGAGTDIITLQNGAAVGTITHIYTNASDGEVRIDGSKVKYDGLEQFDDLLVANLREFDLTGGDDDVTLSDDGIAGNDISRITSVATSVLTNFRSPTNDTIFELKTGDDKFRVADGLDSGFAAALVILGQSDDDTIDASAYDANVTIDGKSGNDVIVGGPGDDVLIGGTGTDTLAFSGDVDVIFSSATEMTGPGTDQVSLFEALNITGGVSANIIDSSEFDWDTTVVGGDGDDTITTGDGNDLIVGGNGNDVISTFDGEDTVQGNKGNDLLRGGKGRDSLKAGEGDDTVLGENGSDNIEGNLGADSIDGGGGKDTIIGGSQDDTIDGGTSNDSIFGNGGDDLITGGSGQDFIDGTNGNDTLSGNEDNDTLHGQSGADIITGGDGADFIDGGTGDDDIEGGTSNDTIWGQDGNDTLNGQEDDDEIYGNDGDDSLKGGSENDLIPGGNGNDILRGHGGDDSLSGGAGHDFLYGSKGNDFLVGGTGNDTQNGDLGDDTLFGGLSGDTSAGTDSLIGGSGADTFATAEASEADDDAEDTLLDPIDVNALIDALWVDDEDDET